MNSVPVLLGSSGDSLREAFGIAITNLAEEYPQMVVLDADIAGGTGVHHFRKAHPSRLIQCGIAEQNMVAMAGGLAATGLLPVVTTFAVFMLRAVEQARLSIAYADMNVKLVASHPGLDVGPDGASAQCLEDIAMFRSIPKMIVLSPCDALEIEQATKAMLDYIGPVYMRTGRSAAKRILDPSYHFQIGKGVVLKEGLDLTIIGCGATTGRALEASEMLKIEGISARVVNMSTIKPIDTELIIKCAKETGKILTVEDHTVMGGLGSAVAEVLVKNTPVPVEFIGMKDEFGESGESEELAARYGLDTHGIIRGVKRLLERSV
jgi:transketolase